MELLKNKMSLYSPVQSTNKKMKGQATRTGRMYLQYIYLIKGLYLQFTKYSYHLIIKQQQKPTLSKWVNDLKRCFSKKDVKCTISMKSCSPLLVIRNMQIKTTTRQYFTPSWKAKIKRTDISVCKDAQLRDSYLLLVVYKMIKPLWKQIGRYLQS